MKTIHADYNNCLVNLSNSILKHYGQETHHSTLPALDKHLKDYKNIVLIVFDGFGSNLLAKYLGENSFLAKNKITDITSVFPATTTAATTSLITGRTPVEHCWLGWDTYIKSMDKIITMFRNYEKGFEENPFEQNICQNEFPFKTIMQTINESKNAEAYNVSPFGDTYFPEDRFGKMFGIIKKLCRSDEKKFIYAYCSEPDHAMHRLGTKHAKILKIMKRIDKKVAKLCKKLEDTLVIITADHGHIDVGEYIVLDDYPILKNMLIRETSSEPRATHFFVREDMLDSFQKEFNNLFGNDFILLSKQEVLDKKIYGDGIPHEKFVSCLGDYLAIAISDKAIRDTHEQKMHKSMHAGITEDEVIVPLIINENK